MSRLPAFMRWRPWSDSPPPPPPDPPRGLKKTLSSDSMAPYSSPSDMSWTIHEANLALYDTLTKPPTKGKRSVLPAEIVLQILENASCWILSQETYFNVWPLHARPTSQESTGLSELWHRRAYKTAPHHATDRSNDKAVVWTDPLSAHDIDKLRKVVIEFESKDQGWSSDSRSHHGKYEHSWSWLELRLDPDSDDTDNERPKAHPTIWRVGTEPLPPLPDRTIHLQSNRHAGKHFETYRFEALASSPTLKLVSHSIDDKSRPSAGPGPGEGPYSSPPIHPLDDPPALNSLCTNPSIQDARADAETDEQRNLFRQLRPGDRIVLDAHARYAGWTCQVRSARILLLSEDDLTDRVKEVPHCRDAPTGSSTETCKEEGGRGTYFGPHLMY